jgi:hypothetical protein
MNQTFQSIRNPFKRPASTAPSVINHFHGASPEAQRVARLKEPLKNQHHAEKPIDSV